MDLLADRGLNLFGQFQQEQPPGFRLVIFLAELIATQEPNSRYPERMIAEELEGEVFPTTLADRIDGARMEAPAEPAPGICKVGSSRNVRILSASSIQKS